MIRVSGRLGRFTERSADQAHPVRPENFWATVAAWRWARRRNIEVQLRLREYVN